MRVELIRGDELTLSLLQRWKEIQKAAGLHSPYFCPEFTQCVADIRDDVEIAVLEVDNEVSGFLPFQRFGSRIGRPVGGRLSDFQAIIATRTDCLDLTQLLRACRLDCLDFDHMLTQQSAFQPYWFGTDESPFIDLSGGYDSYRKRRKQLGDRELRSTARKIKKAEREVGPLRFELKETDLSALDFVVRCKSDQYRRTRITDVFSFPWTVDLLRRLLEEDRPDFAGMLSTLYAGDTLIAAHMGIRSDNILHYWFPTYDLSYANHSPGRILTLKVCQQCPQTGIDRIDLGRGMSDFKRRAMTGIDLVAMGSVDLRPVHRLVRAGWRQTKDWLRNSPLRAPARVPARIAYWMREWMEFR